MLGKRMQMAAAGVGGLPEMSFLGSDVDTTDQQNYSFTSKSFGAAAGDRVIAVAIGMYDNVAHTPSISSVTIGGVSATIIQSTAENTGFNDIVAAVAWAVVPTGTTGTIAVNMNESVLNCAIGWWRIVNLSSSSAYDSDTSTGAALSLNFDNDGVGIVCGQCDASGATMSWANATERFETATGLECSGADHTDTGSGETGRTITLTATGDECVAGVTWR